MKFTANPEAFERLRDVTHALELSEGERSGALLNALAPIHAKQVKKAFDTQGGSTGKIWAPWSAAYAAWRQKYSLGVSMLRLTDTLYEKATVVSHPNFFRGYVSPNKYLFGFMDQIGAWHVQGAGNNPKRSMMDKTEEDVIDFVKGFLEYWKPRTLAILRNMGRV